MTHNRLDPDAVARAAPAGAAVLDLLCPGDLPASVSVDAAAKARLRRDLTRFLEALKSDPAQAEPALRQLLDEIAARPKPCADPDMTDIPASPAEVKDFDRYFGVRRVSRDNPALALWQSLLQTACIVAATARRAPSRDPGQMGRLFKGFRAQARLIWRVCDL